VAGDALTRSLNELLEEIELLTIKLDQLKSAGLPAGCDLTASSCAAMKLAARMASAASDAAWLSARLENADLPGRANVEERLKH
jgi:hypothetical protein